MEVARWADAGVRIECLALGAATSRTEVNAQVWGQVLGGVAELFERVREAHAPARPTQPGEVRAGRGPREDLQPQARRGQPADRRGGAEVDPHIRGDRLEALYLVTTTLGLRQSGVLGLRWSDIDLEAGALSVRRSLQRYNGEYHLEGVKTVRSRRRLNLPDQLMEVLRAHRDRQSFEAWAEGW